MWVALLAAVRAAAEAVRGANKAAKMQTIGERFLRTTLSVNLDSAKTCGTGRSSGSPREKP